MYFLQSSAPNQLSYIDAVSVVLWQSDPLDVLQVRLDFKDEQNHPRRELQKRIRYPIWACAGLDLLTPKTTTRSEEGISIDHRCSSRITDGLASAQGALSTNGKPSQASLLGSLF